MQEKEILKRIAVSPVVEEYARQAREDILADLNTRIDRRAHVLRRFVASAAAVVVFALVGLTGYLSYEAGYRRQNSQPVTLENPLGMRSSVILSDGSRVTLNAGSSLTYPNAFTGRERMVGIHGEGFFEVAPDSSRPFIVTTDDIRIKVLGTKFNVKTYDEEDSTEVTLSEGSVCTGLAQGTPCITMEAGQQVSFDKLTKQFTKRSVNPDDYTAWKEGHFHFSNVTLANIARQLERKFNVHIHISEQLKQVGFSGDFVRGENLEQILRVMTRDRRLHYTIEDDQIHIQ